jgi:hypothetical protein
MGAVGRPVHNFSSIQYCGASRNGAVGRPVHNISSLLFFPPNQVVRCPFSVVETRVSVFLVILSTENGQRSTDNNELAMPRDMRALLRENELRQMNMGSFVTILCFLLLRNQVR